MGVDEDALYSAADQSYFEQLVVLCVFLLHLPWASKLACWLVLGGFSVPQLVMKGIADLQRTSFLGLYL